MQPQLDVRCFAVDDVVCADRPLWAEPLGDHVAKRFRRPVLLVAEPTRPVVNAFYDEVLQTRNLDDIRERTKTTSFDAIP